MTVGLFIPCYVDQFYPNVGRATLSVLEKLGFDVEYPLEQTCCGQPLANTGFEADTGTISKHFLDTFGGFEHVVCPSGSCVLHAREHVAKTDVHPVLHDGLAEFCQFVSGRLDGVDLGSFPRKVGVHQSCHGLRGLRLGKPSELMGAPWSVVHDILAKIPSLEIVELERVDECCGFGGTFAVKEEAISVRMGEDRLDDHLNHGAEIITATDMSCLLHLQGLALRRRDELQFMHVSEILDEVLA